MILPLLLPLNQRYPLVLIVKHHLKRFKQVAADVAKGVGGVEGSLAYCRKGRLNIMAAMAAQLEVFELAFLGGDVAAHTTGQGVLGLSAFEEFELFHRGSVDGDGAARCSGIKLEDALVPFELGFDTGDPCGLVEFLPGRLGMDLIVVLRVVQSDGVFLHIHLHHAAMKDAITNDADNLGTHRGR